MSTELEVQEIIKKNLPSHVGDVLKERLEKAAADEKNVEFLEKKVESLEKMVELKTKQLSEHAAIDSKIADLEKREEELREDNRNLEITILKSQLDSEKEKTAFVKLVAGGLVRNTEYRKSVFDDKQIPGYYEGKNWVPENRQTNSSITTETKE